MKKIVVLVFFISLNAFAVPEELKPVAVLKTSAGNTDAVYKNGKLYVGTELGTVEIVDLNKQKTIEKINLPQILNFFEEYYPPKIYSVDYLNGKLLILAEEEGGYSSLFIYQNKRLNKIISKKDKLIIKKARFVSDEKIVLALLSDEIILFSLKNKKQIYRKQVSSSPFSGFALSPDKKTIAVVTEGGIVYLMDVSTGNLLKKIENTHVDKILSVDYKDNKVMTGGRDRRVYVHDLKKNESIRFNAKFFVYAVGLSPSARIGAYQLNEQADLSIVDLNTRKNLFILKGNEAPLTNIIFIDEGRLITLEESPKIYIWRLHR